MLNGLLRYACAFILFTYGFAKINGSQFTILDSELDKPMGQVSGFWLTWYYFGFSSFYGTFLALVQIVGGVLLTFQRTTLLGACMLAPILLNIVFIDVFYGVELSATGVAIFLLAVMLGLIASRRSQLIALFWPAAQGSSSRALRLLAWFVRIAMLAISCGLTYWFANFNNRSPTPLDGVWQVVRVEPDTAGDKVPNMFFFEFNRAGMTVFKTKNGVYQSHHFEVDKQKNRVRIWETWLKKGTQIFDGSYDLANPQLILRGSLQEAGSVSLFLQRRTDP